MDAGLMDQLGGLSSVAATATPHLPGTPDLHTALLQHHLAPVREPAHHTGDREKHREKVQWEACTRSARGGTTALSGQFVPSDAIHAANSPIAR